MKNLLVGLVAVSLFGGLHFQSYATNSDNAARRRPMTRARTIATSSFESTHEEIFSDRDVASRRYLLGTSLETRFVLTTYLQGGYSIYDLEGEKFSEYAFEGSNPFSEHSDDEVLLYIPPAIYCSRLSDGTYVDDYGRVYTSVELLAMYQKETEQETGEFKFTEEDQVTTSEYSIMPMAGIVHEPYLYTHPNAGTGNTFISNYMFFKNMKRNYGYNMEGTCGILSIEMILNYMDTIYDDAIIDQQYTTNADSGDERYTSIDQFPLSPGTLQYFHETLISIAEAYDAISYTSQGYSMNLAQMKKFIKSYMTDFKSFTTSDFSQFTVENNAWDKMTGALKKRIKKEIGRGNPIIVGLNEFEHACVVYGYTSNNMLACHWGDYDLEANKFVNFDYASVCLGFNEWKKARPIYCPGRYRIDGNIVDAIRDLRAYPTIATHATFKDLIVVMPDMQDYE